MCASMFDLKNLKDAFGTAFKERPHGLRKYIILLTIIFVLEILLQNGQHSTTFLFVRKGMWIVIVFAISNFYLIGFLCKSICTLCTYILGLLVSKLFLTEQSANFRNQYMSYKELKTGFGISLSQTVDLPRFCPRSPRTGSATGYVGRTGANPPFDLEKFRNQFWASYCSCIHSWNSQINPRSDQQP